MQSVSILIPVYNGSKFLPECIESIKSQTHKDYEVIIGINGHAINSTIHRYCNLFASDNIHVIHYSTKGKGNTLNAMVKDAKNNIICLLDVDDVWMPNKLQEQLKYKDRYDIVGTQCYYMYNQTKSTFSPNIPTGIINDFVTCNPIINSSCMINRKDALWEPTTDIEDYALWLKLNKEKKSFYNISEPLVYHRIHKDSYYNASGRNNDTSKLFD